MGRLLMYMTNRYRPKAALGVGQQTAKKQSFERVYKMHEDSVETDKPFWELMESYPNHAAFFLQPNINQRPHHLARLLSSPDEFAI